MAAPAFVGAGAGVTIASGSAACTAAGSGVAVGDLVILQVLQDGTAASAVTYSAISGIANLAGTASSLTVLATDQPCGSPQAAKQHLRVGRATSTTCSVTVATTGDDLYYRLYVFRGANSGSALTDILENGTAGTIANSVSSVGAVLDSPVTALGTERLALNFVAVDDDNALGAFISHSTPELTGGVWHEAVAEFASATGTDGAIQLQLGYLPSITNSGTGSVFNFGTSASVEMRAQSFVPVSATTLKGVALRLRKNAAPADNLVVEIRSDSGGAPSSTVLATATLSGALLASTLSTWPLAYDLALTASTTYWIVARRTGAVDAANSYGWEISPAYAGGVAKTFASGAWGVASGDLAFSILTVADTAAGTIGGGYYEMVAADNSGVIGFALKPVPAVAGTNWEQPVDDTLSLADSATPESGKTATIGDTLVLADATASAAVFARTVTDPVTLADARSSQATFLRAVADTLSVADVLAFARDLHSADTLSLTDQTTPELAGPVLDDFNRANGALGANWTANILNNGLVMPQIVGNQVTMPIGLGSASAWWNAAQFEADCEVRITAADWSGTANLKGTVLYLRVTDPGTSNVDGYAVEFYADTTSGTHDLCTISRFNNGSQTYLAFPAVTNYQDGDELKVEATGTVITASRKRGGSWTVLASHDDTGSALNTAGYVGIRIDDDGAVWDNFNATPAVAAVAHTQPVADTLALADAATSQAAIVRGLADTLSLADTIAAQSAFQLSIVDTLTLADALSSQAAFVRALADTLALADLADPVKGVGGVDHTQPIADMVALADALALIRGLSITDTLAIADSLSSQAAYLRAIADTLSVLDTVVTAEAGIQQIADTLALADTLRFDRTLSLADTLALADALTAGSDLTRAIADTLAIADSLTAQKAILRALADTVSLADALRFGRDLALTDTVALADTVAFQAVYLRTLADTLSVADAATAGLQFTRAIADTVTLLDSLAATLGRAVTLEDVLALADELDALLTAAVGEPPRASGLIDFPGIGTITRPTRGARVGNNRGNINTSHQGVLTKPTRGAT